MYFQRIQRTPIDVSGFKEAGAAYGHLGAEMGDAIAKGIQAHRDKKEKEENETAIKDALVKMGISPEEAEAGAKSPQMLDLLKAKKAQDAEAQRFKDYQVHQQNMQKARLLAESQTPQAKLAQQQLQQAQMEQFTKEQSFAPTDIASPAVQAQAKYMADQRNLATQAAQGDALSKLLHGKAAMLNAQRPTASTTPKTPTDVLTAEYYGKIAAKVKEGTATPQEKGALQFLDFIKSEQGDLPGSRYSPSQPFDEGQGQPGNPNPLWNKDPINFQF